MGMQMHFQDALSRCPVQCGTKNRGNMDGKDGGKVCGGAGKNSEIKDGGKVIGNNVELYQQVGSEQTYVAGVKLTGGDDLVLSHNR